MKKQFLLLTISMILILIGSNIALAASEPQDFDEKTLLTTLKYIFHFKWLIDFPIKVQEKVKNLVTKTKEIEESQESIAYGFSDESPYDEEECPECRIEIGYCNQEGNAPISITCINPNKGPLTEVILYNCLSCKITQCKNEYITGDLKTLDDSLI